MDQRQRGKRRGKGKHLQTPAEAVKLLTSADSPALTGHLALGAVWLTHLPAPTTLALEAALLGRRMAAAWVDEPLTQEEEGEQEGEQDEDAQLMTEPVDGTPGGSAAPAVVADEAVFRLSLEEAFYMMHQLRCLTIMQSASRDGDAAGDTHTGGGSAPTHDDAVARSSKRARTESGPSDAVVEASHSGATVLTDEQCYAKFRVLNPKFVYLYAAFNFYRGKGWMPRSGLQYGAHFVLYKRHPALCHSDYAVVVMPPEVASASATEPFFPSWTELLGNNRLASQVAKRLLLLYMLVQPGFDETRLDRAGALSCHEVLVTRWVPARHRDRKPDEN